MNLRELIKRLRLQNPDTHPFPENIDTYLDDFVPNVLLKSETLQKAFGVPGKDMEDLYNEAFEHYDANRFGDAKGVFKWLVILNPFQKKYWMGLAATQQTLEDYDKALHSYAVAALLDSENPYPHYYAYLCYVASDEEKNQDDAQKALEMAFVRCSGKAAHRELKEEICHVRRNGTTHTHTNGS